MGEKTIMERHLQITDREVSNALKGVCAIMVALGHALPYQLYIFIPGAYFVGLFFWFSGYGVMKSYINIPDYLKHFIMKRVIKCWIPFAIAEVIFLFICNAGGDWLRSIAFAIIGVRLSNSSLWYIVEIGIFWCLFYLSYRTIYNLKRYDLIYWIIVYVLFLVMATKCNIGTYAYQATSCLLCGIIFAKYEEYFTRLYRKLKIIRDLSNLGFIVGYITHILISFDIYYGRGGTLLPYFKIILTMAMCPLFVMFVSNICEKFSVFFKKNIFNKLGAISLEIYLYHYLVIYLIGTDSLLKICTVMLITICMAVLMWGVDKAIENKLFHLFIGEKNNA